MSNLSSPDNEIEMDQYRRIGSAFWDFYEQYHGHPFEYNVNQPEAVVHKRVIEAALAYLLVVGDRRRDRSCCLIGGPNDGA